MKEITIDKLNKLDEKYKKDIKNEILENALYTNMINSVVINRNAHQNNPLTFSHFIKTQKVSNQFQSGRCWIFAGLNVLREEICKQFNVSDFELSQNYVAYYDKIEKVNYALNLIEENINLDYDDRLFSFIVENPINDGGQWDMFVSLINKYGVVPKSCMYETKQSENTREMNFIIKMYIQKFAAKAKQLYNENKKSEISKLREKYFDVMYSFISNCFGSVPRKIDFSLEMEDKTLKAIAKDITPQEFYKQFIKIDLNNYISIINAPTKSKPFNTLYTIEALGNVVNGNKVLYLNVDMDSLVDLTYKQLKNNELVWFGSDVSPYRIVNSWLWDDKALNYNAAFGINFNLEKGDMLDFGQSRMNHAMVICGYDLDENKSAKDIKRWKIQNSWGEKSGKKGYHVMSNSWFCKFTYQCVIHKKYLTKQQLKALNQDPIVLKPWDPMGTLAD